MFHVRDENGNKLTDQKVINEIQQVLQFSYNNNDQNIISVSKPFVVLHEKLLHAYSSVNIHMICNHIVYFICFNMCYLEID